MALGNDVKKLHEIAKECSSFKQLAEKSGLGNKELQAQIRKFPPLHNQLKHIFKGSSGVNYLNNNDIELPEGDVIVLDASVIHARNLMEAIDVFIKAGKIFVLTSITIKELDLKKAKLRSASNAQKRRAGRNAQQLLAKAVEEPENIFPVEIPESSLNPDDDIIESLKGVKDVVLWTGDKPMVLKARMFKIPNIYIGEEIEIPTLEECEETQKDVQSEIILQEVQEEQDLQEVKVEEEETLQEVQHEEQETIDLQELEKTNPKKALKLKMEAIASQIADAKAELEGIIQEQENLKVKQESKESDLETLQAELSELQEESKKYILPIYEPNSTIFKSEVREGNLYLSGRVNKRTTKLEVYDEYGNKKHLKEVLNIGDTVLVVIVKENYSSVMVREEQVVRIANESNAHILFQKRIYSLELNELKNALPKKYYEAVKEFLEN